MTQKSPSYPTVMWRSWRLRCPRCGQGKLFRGWFRMHPQCDRCGLDLRREPGFYLGSIYVNYGLTALLVTFIYVGNFVGEFVDQNVLFWCLVAFTVLFPLFFFRYARAIWLGFDEFWDPSEKR